MAIVYLGLGSNLGDASANLRLACTYIIERIGSQVALSQFYTSEPWGFVSEHPFVNAAISVETSLSPNEVLLTTQQIEKEMGRTEKTSDGYEDRIIDIDLLMYDDLLLETNNLTLPHPFLSERSFVLQPLAEIAPNLLHPIKRKIMKDLLDEFWKR